MFGTLRRRPLLILRQVARRPDTRRFNQKGLFDIICKQSQKDADPE
jgi:hypothetical protein